MIKDDIGPLANARVRVQARVFPKQKGNKLCKDDLSPQKEKHF